MQCSMKKLRDAWLMQWHITSMASIQILCRITGRVQGVAYRAWTVGNARELGLKGWVRNRSDSSVEALFCGEAALVKEMVARCHEGPLAAKVIAVETQAATDHPVPPDFTKVETL